jgi:hypothetical protein
MGLKENILKLGKVLVDVLDTAGYPFLLAHELCHYGAARLLGVRARLQRDRVIHSGGPTWKMVIITLAPAIVGAPIVFLLVYFFPYLCVTLSEQVFGLGVIAASVVWVFVGWYDFIEIIYRVRHGRWLYTTDYERLPKPRQ